MGKNRLEAFSDGVIAIIITIMVLDSKSRTTRLPRAAAAVAGVLSFKYAGIYGTTII